MDDAALAHSAWEVDLLRAGIPWSALEGATVEQAARWHARVSFLDEQEAERAARAARG